MAVSLRRLIIGRPLESERAAHEKLSKFLALPVFSSDALSSVAYATGEIMAALLLATSAHLGLTFPISIAIAALLLIITTSYRQTVQAYPSGGGAYIVARENLGVFPAQVAGASLLIDYILTVAVSISAGVMAIDSLARVQWGHGVPVVPICLAAVVLITLVNLRGVKESGAIFALPTYGFILIVAVVTAVGLWRLHIGDHTLMAHPVPDFLNAKPGMENRPSLPQAFQPLGWFLVLRAFASGCSALTGVEAISNGVTAFKQPAARNAAATMTIMSSLLGAMFLGLSYLAVHVHALPETAIGVQDTVMSQIGRSVFLGGVGSHPVFGGEFLYFWLQIATALILVLAANTSYADFPRLSALIAKDGFLPKQLANVGDRLVFDRGIFALAFLASILIVHFRGDVHLLIPLYAVGVFLSFTLSQAGMVKHWFKLRSAGWRLKAVVNGVGAVCTCIVLVVFAVTKFIHGAYLVIILIPTFVVIFYRIHAHYASVRQQLRITEGSACLNEVPPKHAVLVLVPGVTRGSLEAVQYARSLAGDCRAVHVEMDPEKTPRLREEWERFCGNVPLIILESPYRSVVRPFLDYLTEAQRETPNTRVTVVIPEFVAPHGWQNLLHGHTGLVLKWNLLNRRNVVVTNVRYHLEDERVQLAHLFDVENDVTRRA